MAVTQEQPLEKHEFDRIARFLYDHCGIHLTDTKRDLVKARLAKRLRVTGIDTYGQYIDHVLADPEGIECYEFIDALSTNLTSFFRESRHFDYLAQELLPEIVRRNQHTRRIRAWSAACSSGEEPYTLAIVLNETLPKIGAGRGWDTKLLATDISTRVLKKAQLGVYGMDRVKSVAPALRGKYFEPRKIGGEEHAAVSPQLRSMITFARLNLMERWPFTGPFDFIFCRNVMIYFDKPTQEKLVARYYDLLTPGGVLFTGHSESLTGINHKFDFVEATIYRKS
jgi:chemotaxis protein methyltransferase CheR